MSEEEFKAEQCAATDNQTLLGVRYHWVPHTGQQGKITQQINVIMLSL